MYKVISEFFENQKYTMSLYARQIAGTLILFIIAHYLSVYEYGLFSSYKNIATFCLLFANLGYADYILVSTGARVVEVKAKTAMFMGHAILLTVLFMAISFLFGLDDRVLFLLIMVRTFFDVTFFSLILPCFQAEKNFDAISKINFIYSFFVTVIAVVSYLMKLPLVTFLWLNILLGVVNFLQCSRYAKIKYFGITQKVSQMLDRGIFAYVGVTLAYLLYAQIPSLYVSVMLTKEEAALYFAAFTISGVIALLVTAQTQKRLPEMIGADNESAKAVIKSNLKFLVGATVLIFLFTVVAGKALLRLLYGQDYYTNAYVVLLILMLGNICVAEAAVYGAYITASDNQRKKIPMQLEATFVTVLMLLLLREYSIVGAASSFLISSVYIAFRYTKFTKKFLK